MILYLHDNTPAGPGEKHGSRGPTHCGTIRDVDYEYQVEEHVKMVEEDHDFVVRIECLELGCEWNRDANKKFVRGPIKL